MFRATILLALLGLCGLAAAGSTQQYSSIQPATYNLTLTYNIAGSSLTPAPCNYTNQACLPDVYTANKDSITIAYTGPAGAPGNTVSLMYCYSPTSSKNRAWRKANAVISKDKQCNVASPIKKGLPTGSGSFTWTPSVNLAYAIYNIQLLEVVNGSNPTTYAAMGRSPGYFEIVPIDSTPGWLMVMTGVFCAIGPLTLAGFFTYEKVYKKE